MLGGSSNGQGWRGTGTDPGGSYLSATGLAAGDLPEGDFSVQALAQPDLYSTLSTVVSMGTSGNSAQVARLLYTTSPAQTMGFRVSSTNYNATAAAVAGTGVVRAAHGTVDTTGNELKSYEDGALRDTNSSTISAASPDWDQVGVGSHAQDTALVAGQWFWDGNLDEVRIRNDVLTDEWVRAEHLMQSDPNTYITVGTPSDVSSGPGPVTPNLDGSTGLSVGMSRPMSRPLSGAL
jgi:hypothetical protein